MSRIKKYQYLLLILFLFLAYSCSSLRYYGHNIRGHFSLLAKRVPIEDILQQKTNSDKELKRRLQLALAVRQFAADTLFLPNHGSYQHYVTLKDPYIKWNVIAAPEFSIKPKLWCFLVVGCVSYRGYYNEKDAQTFAGKAKSEGYDVYISGAIAYSTLGWFEDPLLSTMMQWSDLRMAEFIIHELAHQKIYIKNDQDFNEAFATMVARHGVEKWSQLQNKPEEWAKYITQKRKEYGFIQLALQIRNELDVLYQSSKSDKEKKPEKKAIIASMQPLYQEKLKLGQVPKLKKWFDNANNAKFALLASYQDHVPAFLQLLSQQQGNLPAFYKAVKQIGKLPQKQRREKLEQLLLNMDK